jgi:hypothetical protein
MSRQRAVWLTLMIFVGLVLGAVLARANDYCDYSYQPYGPVLDTYCFTPSTCASGLYCQYQGCYAEEPCFGQGYSYACISEAYGCTYFGGCRNEGCS